MKLLSASRPAADQKIARGVWQPILRAVTRESPSAKPSERRCPRGRLQKGEVLAGQHQIAASRTIRTLNESPSAWPIQSLRRLTAHQFGRHHVGGLIKPFDIRCAGT